MMWRFEVIRWNADGIGESQGAFCTLAEAQDHAQTFGDVVSIFDYQTDTFIR